MTHTQEMELTRPVDPRVRPLSERQLKNLLAGLNPKRISSRSQGSRSLSYLEAWDIRRVLICVFGFGGFSAVASEAKVINTEQVPKPAPRNGGDPPPGFNYRVTVMVRMVLRIHQLDCDYGEYASSSQTAPDPGDAMDFAIKTAESDALKRCAVNLGTQFGLSLYNNGDTADVVKKIIAPHQEYPLALPPAADGESRAAAMFPTPAEGVTPEQHADNVNLVDRAFSAAAARHSGEDTVNNEQAAVLDPSLNGAGEEAPAEKQTVNA